LLTLGRPNLPATKNWTEPPPAGTDSVRLVENDPVVPLRNTIAPPPAADLPVRTTLTEGVRMPDGLVTRIRHGEGAHATKRAPALVLLLICNSTFIAISFW
jgi:hypothetical protein